MSIKFLDSALVHVLWEDGRFGVIAARDLGPNMLRSKTSGSPSGAIKADPSEVIDRPPVGPKSQGHYVKVLLSEFLAYKNAGQATARAPTAVNPYPHKCPTCGGRMLVLFSSIDHEGGVCPGRPTRMRTR